MNIPKIEGKIEDGYIKIYINDLLHLSIKVSEYIGIQSWIYPGSTTPYNIEYYTKSKKILTQYDSIEKWKTILTFINSISY